MFLGQLWQEIACSCVPSVALEGGILRSGVFVNLFMEMPSSESTRRPFVYNITVG